MVHEDSEPVVSTVMKSWLLDLCKKFRIVIVLSSTSGFIQD